MSDYTRVTWFSHLDPLIQPKYACSTMYIGVTAPNVPGFFSFFSCCDYWFSMRTYSNLVLATDW